MEDVVEPIFRYFHPGITLALLLEILRYAIALLSVLTAILPIWSKFDATQGERLAFVAFSFAIVFLVWPVDCSLCKSIPDYRYW